MTLDDWDDELDEAERVYDNRCLRATPPGVTDCTQGYDHGGRCDWFADTYAGVVAKVVAAQTHRDNGRYQCANTAAAVVAARRTQSYPGQNSWNTSSAVQS